MDGKGMWKFEPCHSDNVSTHIYGSDFTKSSTPAINDCNVCSITDLVSSWNLVLMSPTLFKTQ